MQVAVNDDRFREALSWAVAFIRCNNPHICDGYPDFKNAEAMVRDGGELMHGPFQMALIRAELAEVKVAELTSEIDRLRAEVRAWRDQDREGVRE